MVRERSARAGWEDRGRKRGPRRRALAAGATLAPLAELAQLAPLPGLQLAMRVDAKGRGEHSSRLAHSAWP